MNKDEAYMAQALTLARLGEGRTSPNPMVGAVLVKEGRIIGQGYHRRYGGLHAEREALAACTESPAGAELYVTLEPCCHTGRQPPCTEAVIRAGIRRVVIGSPDPNPLVSGQGAGQLRQAGIQVESGVLRRECDRLNRVFFHFIQSGLPYGVMKFAMTLDGKIASRTGASRWITGEAARRRAHEDRNRFSAILVGSGTVLADDPLLTCRMEGGRNPLRIILNSRLDLPLGCRIIATAAEVPTLIATCSQEAERIRRYEKRGCRVLSLSPDEEGRVPIGLLMRRLGEEKVDSVLMEGGSQVHWSALKAGAVQRVEAFLSPMLLGGQTAPGPIGGEGFARLEDALRLEDVVLTRLGEDYLLEGEVAGHVYRNR